VFAAYWHELSSSPLSGYELFRSSNVADRKRICRAVGFSRMIMSPPQHAHGHERSAKLLLA
jgi:hypothetical protein